MTSCHLLLKIVLPYVVRSKPIQLVVGIGSHVRGDRVRGGGGGGGAARILDNRGLPRGRGSRSGSWFQCLRDFTL